MIRFKNRKGFGLLETVCAVAIAAIIIAPLFILQGTIVQRVSSSAEHFYRSLVAKNFLYEMRREQESDAQEFAQQKQEIDPAVSLNYTLQSVTKKSSLAPIQGLKSETVHYTWQWNGLRFDDALVTFVYKQS